jgi:hypothetical protein
MSSAGTTKARINLSGFCSSFPTRHCSQKKAANLGIRGPNDLYGGVFIKTKAITHQLIDNDAARPEGWSELFADRAMPCSRFPMRGVKRKFTRQLCATPFAAM